MTEWLRQTDLQSQLYTLYTVITKLFWPSLLTQITTSICAFMLTVPHIQCKLKNLTWGITHVNQSAP